MPTPTSNVSSDRTVITAVVACVGAVLASTLCVVVTVILFLALKRRRKYRLKSENPTEQELQVISDGVSPGRAVDLQHDGASGGAIASPEGLELLKMNSMAIPRDTIELMGTIGKGVHGTTLIIIIAQRLGLYVWINM